MLTKISADIVSSKPILDKTFTCKCGSLLLMDGCTNEDCDNYFKKRIAKYFKVNQRTGA